MTITVSTHLNFRGDARAALEHYQSVFGGHLVVMTRQDAGIADDPAEADHVVWGQVAADNGFRVMAFDVPASQGFARGERSFFVSVRGDSADEIAGYWHALRVGGTIVEDLAPSQWSPLYGMVTDRFGVTWVLDVAVEYAPA
jgi:PhnB protein